MSEISGNNPKYVTASTQTRKTKMPDFANQLSPIPAKNPEVTIRRTKWINCKSIGEKRSSSAFETEKANSESNRFPKPANRPYGISKHGVF